MMVTSTTMAQFRALPLPEDEASQQRLLRVMRSYDSHFGHPPTGIARSPGRVNLIGEHVDYEGYAVLPMAIEQSVFVAFNTVNCSSTSGGKMLQLTNTKSQYNDVTLVIDGKTQDMMKNIDTKGADWAKYVLCGVLGVQDTYPELFLNKELKLQLLVDGDIPVGCGLSSSSALVVASALATIGALQRSSHELPSRIELAELCRQAEHYVGTMGGGMDQAVACLAQRGVALHLNFSDIPLRSNPVNIPIAGARFVIANSLVIAEKAVDAATRFNKRVVECALAAKLIAKKAGIDNWKYMTRLVDVQTALSMDFDELKKRASVCCPLTEYTICELETEFGEQIRDLFIGSSLETSTKAVLVSASSFKLQQRALHVWGEAERVEKFRTLCASISIEEDSLSDNDILHSSFLQNQLKSLGKLMCASHYSCRDLYECSCPELDALVDAAITAGALGARLTGTGWGGCIVALVQKADVSTFMKKLQPIYYDKLGILSAEASDIMFEAIPAPGADIFRVE